MLARRKLWLEPVQCTPRQVQVQRTLLVAIVLRLVFTPSHVSVERLDLSICVCRHLVCRSCNKPCDRVDLHSCYDCVSTEKDSQFWSCGRTSSAEILPNFEGIFLPKRSRCPRARRYKRNRPCHHQLLLARKRHVASDEEPVTFDRTRGCKRPTRVILLTVLHRRHRSLHGPTHK